MNTTIHPELLHSYGPGYKFWLFDDCDTDDIGRWMTESWEDAELSIDAEQMQQHIWFARACNTELVRRAQPIVCAC